MIKFYSSFILLFLSSFFVIQAARPKANFGKYGIEKHASLEEYQKYLGKVVVYVPEDVPTKEDLNVFKGRFDTEYIILNISGNDKRMKFVLQEKNGKSKIKMTVNNYETLRDYGLDTYCITDQYSIPLFLVEEFNNDKINFIGKKYSNSKAKAFYEVSDVFIDKRSKFNDSKGFTLIYVLTNSITGEQIILPSDKIETDCFKKDLAGKYFTTLREVEKPVNENSRFGETEIVEEEGLTKYSYGDDLINIIIYSNNENFSFRLENVSQNTIKLIWDEAVYVDYEGNTSNIIHKGVKYAQKNESQVASTIIKGAYVDDVAIPSSNINYDSNLNNWFIASMFPEIPYKSPGDIKLMLPIQVKDTINEYIFAFSVDWVYDHPELVNL